MSTTAPPDGDPPAGASAPAITVLVVDDHEIVSLGVIQALAGLPRPTDVRWTRTLDGLDDVLADTAVAILDLRLDDGSAPAKNIAALRALGVPVVIYTSGDEPILVREAIAAGALSVVRKSARPQRLVDAIDAALEGRVEPGLDWAAALEADEDFVLDHLSESEVRVLTRYASGEASDAVARHLHISRNTVHTYIARIRAKYLEVGRPAESRVDLFRRAAEDGLVNYYDPTTAHGGPSRSGPSA